MNILILGGESVSNKEFIERLYRYLSEKGYDSILTYYNHWDTIDGTINISDEVNKIINLIQDKDIKIVIAKSIGCVIGHTLLEGGYLKESKFVLLGLPLNLEKLSTMSRGNFGRQCMIIQNEHDRVGSYIEIEKVFGDKVTKVINIPGNNTHKYEDYTLIYDTVQNFL